MVFEMLMNPKKAERSPWELFFVGLIYATVSVFLSLWIFEDFASLVMVFLTVLSCTYLIQGTIRMEEEKDMQGRKEYALIKEHGKALAFFVFLFWGFTIAFSLWYIILPGNIVSNLFDAQISTITSINQFTGNAVSGQHFTLILANNIKVLLFTTLFAFFYGAGAVFILAWNASVIGTAIGNFVRTGIAEAASAAGLVKMNIYFSALSFGLLRYLTHGMFEILAYFVGALGAGIISIAVVRHHYTSENFRKVVLDSLDLFMVAIGLLIVAAAVEVWVTPVFFT